MVLLRLITDGPTDKSSGLLLMDSPTDKNPPDVGLLLLITDGPTDKSPGPFFGPYGWSYG